MAEKKIARKKLETAKKLVELIKNNDTIIIVSIKGLPSRQFQDIRKELRGKAETTVVKKRITLRAIEEYEKEDKKIGKLKDYVQEDSAILFSKQDAFELAGLLAEKKNPIKAKAGQEAIEDIEVNEGPTDLVPGPAISELGALGIKISVEDGKIAIKEKKVIVGAGKRISEDAASVMAKLNIQPFKIGLEPIVMYDKKTGSVYTNVKIDKEKTIEELKKAKVRSLGLAQKIVYYCRESIGFLLGKANAEGKALEKKKTSGDTVQNIQKTEESKSTEEEK